MQINDGYLIVFYDLPTLTKQDIRNYNKFRKKLISFGYEQLQKSVYYKYIRDLKTTDRENYNIKSITSNDSNVVSLKITKMQFEKIQVISGEFNYIDRSVSCVEY